ncbi:hypothetical protein ACFS5L_37450 [Streptomyces phyllanthi]|uniref:PH domain-containing protein n=1 Tax=Streptomyces phyllanthi TaxID=1803180 RepID=A0A5N8W990_9ACTN|nr:hypothetical protein [Streptomyces phyllanthi]MPY43919.1 hypothetical protein [Streptomyces phyllanthi]
MELSPSLWNRVANSGLGVVPGVVSVLYWAQAGDGLRRLAAGVAVVGCAVLAVRGCRLGASCAGGKLTVRGYLRTRVIPRASITEITDFPAVRWTTGTGCTRWTPITAFATAAGETAGSRGSKERSIASIRRWARSRGA